MEVTASAKYIHAFSNSASRATGAGSASVRAPDSAGEPLRMTSASKEQPTGQGLARTSEGDPPGKMRAAGARANA